MLSLPRPPFKATETYSECASGVRDKSRKERYESDEPSVTDADTRYVTAGAAGAAHTLPSEEFQMRTVPTGDMVWLYENRLAGRSSSARVIYDALKQIGPYGRCALCGVRDATTLDHFLPKSAFPALAVNPLNLVPSCGRCNQLKSDRVGGMVHAYFDNTSGAVWLIANLVESKPCVALFDVVSPPNWPADLAGRAREHFARLQLGSLYAAQASRTMRGDTLAFRRAFEFSGPEGIRSYVEERAESWANHEPNCWEAALYTALSRSDWFCEGGFEEGLHA